MDSVLSAQGALGYSLILGGCEIEGWELAAAELSHRGWVPGGPTGGVPDTGDSMYKGTQA